MFPNTIMEEIILSLLYTVGIVSWMSWLCMHGLTSVLSILFHWSTCLFLYQTVLTTMCAVLCLFAQSCPNLWDPMDCILWDSSIHGDFPGKSTGVKWHCLLCLLLLETLNPGKMSCWPFFIGNACPVLYMNSDNAKCSGHTMWWNCILLPWMA